MNNFNLMKYSNKTRHFISEVRTVFNKPKYLTEILENENECEFKIYQSKNRIFYNKETLFIKFKIPFENEGLNQTYYNQNIDKKNEFEKFRNLLEKYEFIKLF